MSAAVVPLLLGSSMTTSSAKSGAERTAHEDPIQQALEDPHRQEPEQNTAP